jgi:hypothetical protein
MLPRVFGLLFIVQRPARHKHADQEPDNASRKSDKGREHRA